MAKLLVTGGAGFIGSNLTDRLIQHGHEVVVIDNFSTGKKENLNQNAKFINSDISDYKTIAPHFEGVEAVFHTAALARIQPSIKDPLAANETNVTGTLNVLWAAKNSGVKKFIYSASSSCYGPQPAANFPLKETLPKHPGSPYALQKLVGEMYCELFSQLYDLSTVVLRYFNVYGPRQITEGAYAAVVGIFLKQKQEGKPMTITGDGQQRRDFTHVSDVVEANILSWKKNIAGAEAFNIGRGSNHSINEVAQLVGGSTVNIAARPGEYPVTLADNSKAREILGWTPRVDMEEGVAELKKSHGLQ
ncbi:MAG: SDR family oxidoreductase [bacterium]|nr:SDR family oxidoreductase [bacterium]